MRITFEILGIWKVYDYECHTWICFRKWSDCVPRTEPRLGIHTYISIYTYKYYLDSYVT